MSAWRSLFSHLGSEHQRRLNECDDATLSQEENRNRQNSFLNRIFTERQALLAKLLHCMAKALGFKIEQLEIFEGGYTPQGWADDDLEARIVRRLFVEVAAGRRSFPIAVVDYTQGGIDQIAETS